MAARQWDNLGAAGGLRTRSCRWSVTTGGRGSGPDDGGMRCAFPPYAALSANAGWGPGGFPSIGELEELDGVAGPDLALIIRQDVGVDLVDDRPGIGPFVLD